MAHCCLGKATGTLITLSFFFFALRHPLCIRIGQPRMQPKFFCVSKVVRQNIQSETQSHVQASISFSVHSYIESHISWLVGFYPQVFVQFSFQFDPFLKRQSYSRIVSSRSIRTKRHLVLCHLLPMPWFLLDWVFKSINFFLSQTCTFFLTPEAYKRNVEFSYLYQSRQCMHS